MNEFNNRISAQREILTEVNSSRWTEELFGLSQGALERWFSVNKVNKTSRLASLLFEAAEKLFFLANKSQEQITEEYKNLSLEIEEIKNLIAVEVKNSSI